MRDIRDIIDDLASAEAKLRERLFLSPCISGGNVRTRIEGIVYEFKTRGDDFEGWGIFRPVNVGQAELAEESSLPMVDRYLALLPSIRLRLVAPLQGKSWLAFPLNSADARLRLGHTEPLAVHLVENGSPFERIVAGWDGTALWFSRHDRRADPLIGAALRKALHEETGPHDLRIKGMNPEDRIAYELLWSRILRSVREEEHRRNEKRLRDALERAGGILERFREEGDAWLVEWHTPDGERHTSLISRADLTVVGAGICLSGGDRNFDLQSLVGVVEGRPDWMR